MFLLMWPTPKHPKRLSKKWPKIGHEKCPQKLPNWTSNGPPWAPKWLEKRTCHFVRLRPFSGKWLFGLQGESRMTFGAKMAPCWCAKVAVVRAGSTFAKVLQKSMQKAPGIVWATFTDFSHPPVGPPSQIIHIFPIVFKNFTLPPKKHVKCMFHILHLFTQNALQRMSNFYTYFPLFSIIPLFRCKTRMRTH